jgi:hypothetical protein
MGVTVLHEGRLHLRIDPRTDGAPWLADTASLARALAEAGERLAMRGPRACAVPLSPAAKLGYLRRRSPAAAPYLPTREQSAGVPAGSDAECDNGADDRRRERQKHDGGQHRPLLELVSNPEPYLGQRVGHEQMFAARGQSKRQLRQRTVPLPLVVEAVG